MRLNGKCKSESIMYHCIYVNCRYIKRIDCPRSKYAAYANYSMFDRALLHKNTIYAKATYLNYTDNILQKACYNPRILHNPRLSLIKYKTIYTKARNYHRSPVYNMIDKCCTFQDADEIEF